MAMLSTRPQNLSHGQGTCWGSSYLLLLKHPPKVFITRVLIEPSPPARQNIIDCWLHFIFVYCNIVRDCFLDVGLIVRRKNRAVECYLQHFFHLFCLYTILTKDECSSTSKHIIIIADTNWLLTTMKLTMMRFICEALPFSIMFSDVKLSRRWGVTSSGVPVGEVAARYVLDQRESTVVLW